jgi:uncharacterized membrane protein
VIAAGLYDWLVLGHILAAMVWLGGGVLVAAMALVALRDTDAQALARFAGTLRVVGPAVLAPGAVITLGFGVWLVLDSAAWGFGQTWVRVAIGLVVVAVGVGAGYQARTVGAAERAIARDDPAEARRQLVRWIAGYALVVVLLVGIAWDMVFKPGL